MLVHRSQIRHQRLEERRSPSMSVKRKVTVSLVSSDIAVRPTPNGLGGSPVGKSASLLPHTKPQEHTPAIRFLSSLFDRCAQAVPCQFG